MKLRACADCRKEFCETFERTAGLGTGERITVEAPFSDGPKSAIINMDWSLVPSLYSKLS
ncbi:MAG: 7-cyano-7-deazaguanine synthase [Candidatus Bathyarchaeota archaeon]